jgi:hypothetical protein
MPAISRRVESGTGLPAVGEPLRRLARACGGRNGGGRVIYRRTLPFV